MKRRLFPGLLIVAALVATGCGVRPAERRESIYSLQSDPTPRNIEELRRLLEDPSRDVRATALNVLVELEVDDGPELALAGLGDGDGFVRATAARLVGETGDPSFAPQLAQCLVGDADPLARQRAAEGLARLEGSAAVEALARGLEDPAQQVRLAAVRGLGALDPGFAKMTLSRLLIEDAVWEVRAQAAQTLGATGDPEVVAMLQAALDDPNEFVRSAAAGALRVHAEVRRGAGA